MLFLLFKSFSFAALIILVLPFASIGGVVSLFVTGEYLSVPASVGLYCTMGDCGFKRRCTGVLHPDLA